jgi:cytochrome c biogenesis protein CcmG/thiol:disulfide interchange protein DsbE
MSWLRWLPLGVFVLLASIFAIALFMDRPGEGSFALVGEPAPTFILPGLSADEGVGLAHADLIGGPVSIVNVWASWCAPCRVEHPQLTELSRDGRVQVLGISYRDDPADARAFLDELGDPFDRIGVDADGRAALDWGVTGPPETFIVAPDGTIIAKHVGAITPEVLRQSIRPAIDEAARRR